MARPIDHDTGSSVVTGAWETGKGVMAGAAVVPIVGALLGAAAVAFFSTSLLPLAIGAVAGGVGLSIVGAPAITGLAALGGLFGMGHGASKISKEKAAYQSQVMHASQRDNAQQMMAAQQGLQQGYQAGFQEGQQFAVQQIQHELQQQAMQQQQQKLPEDGHAAREIARRGGHQHTSKADMVAHQKEQASTAGHEVS